MRTSDKESDEMKNTEIIAQPGLKTDLLIIERQRLLEALKMAHGNRTKAGKLLGMSLRQTRYHMAKLQITREVMAKYAAEPAPAPADTPAHEPATPINAFWKLIETKGLGYFEGKAVEAVLNWNDTGDVRDLRDARKYLDHLIEGSA